MTTTLSWRLSKLPTVEELRELVKDNIITQEEARQILFNQDGEKEKNIKDLENEIKFLKEIIEGLSKGNRQIIVETIKYIERPYYNRPWYQPYQIWCASHSTNTLVNNAGNNVCLADNKTFSKI